jgi:hypothetical protein
MMLRSFLAQTTENAAFSFGAVIVYVTIGVLLVLMAVNTKITIEAARRDLTQGGLIGLALFLSVLAPLFLLVLVGLGFMENTGWLLYAFGAGAFTWILTVVCFTMVSRTWKTRDSMEAAAMADNGLGNLDAEFPEDFGLDAPAAQAHPQGVSDLSMPRRAVSIPAAESDSSRASEQTLKRMTLDRLESASSEPKGPRASEIAENPILPDEVVKVRCLACDKKMQAEGPKFMKQRRCPNCKAAPFRYVTAV